MNRPGPWQSSLSSFEIISESCESRHFFLEPNDSWNHQITLRWSKKANLEKNKFITIRIKTRVIDIPEEYSRSRSNLNWFLEKSLNSFALILSMGMIFDDLFCVKNLRVFCFTIEKILNFTSNFDNFLYICHRDGAFNNKLF